MKDCYESDYTAVLLSCSDLRALSEVADEHGSTVAAVIRGLVKEAIKNDTLKLVKPVRRVQDSPKKQGGEKT